MNLYVEQDALDAAIKVPYELSPQEMVDYLIENGYAVVEDVPQTPRQRWGTCCPNDPECEHSFLDAVELAEHMDTPVKEER